MKEGLNEVAMTFLIVDLILIGAALLALFLIRKFAVRLGKFVINLFTPEKDEEEKK
jgi:hypothetical protein